MLAVSLSWAVLASPLLSEGDFSRYRSFRIGTDLATIAGQARMDPSRAKVVHRRPALIQELEWRPQPLGPSTQAEAVSEVVFSFYNGELYRLVVNYDRHKTEGLTAEDLIAAISATYGSAARGAAEIVLPSIHLVAVSKRLDVLARAAVIEAVRLDAQEAPRREIALQDRQAEESRVQQEKARLANKPGFRP